MREIDYHRVMNMVQNKFDGIANNLLSTTSLHLSFTEYHVPLFDKNVKMGQDSQVSILESVISVHDAGEWVADVDIIKALDANRIGRWGFTQPGQPGGPTECGLHHEPGSRVPSMRSVEDWEEIMDFPEDAFVVRAYGDWAARLAVTAVLSQVMERAGRNPGGMITICPQSPCWLCAYKMRKQFTNHGFIY